MGDAITQHQLSLTRRSQSQMEDWMHLARKEDQEKLKGKSDNFVRGWCQVKHAEARRGSHEG